MPPRDVVVVGASAGGIEALRGLLEGLPADLSASVLIVLHIAPHAPSHLAEILARASRLPVRSASEGDPLRPGQVYVASPDRHLLLMGGRLRLGRGPAENRHRPAVDPLFRSAARERGPGVVGVILSGMLDDGAAGLAAVKACGGLTLVQDPEEALFSDMPLNAIRNVDVDHCLPVAGLADRLAGLVGRPIDGVAAPCPHVDALQVETEMGMSIDDVRKALQKIGTPASVRCPECQGPIWEINDPDVLRFRCEVGHAFTAGSFEDGQAELIERALWSAVSALEEKAVVSRRIAQRSRDHKLVEIARMYETRAKKAVQEAEAIRRALRQALERTSPPSTPGRAKGRPRPAGRAEMRKPRNGSPNAT